MRDEKEAGHTTMARPGISYTDVEKIAHTLQGQGIFPRLNVFGSS